MTSKEVKVYLSKQIAMCEEKIELYENAKASKDFIELHKNLLDFYKTIEKDLEVLEILKPRVRLKDSTLKNAHFTIDENGLPVCENDFKEVDVAFIETSGFVFKNSKEHELLKEWKENE